MKLNCEQYSVVGDIHAETEVLKAVHQSRPYGSLLITAGDTIHGYDTPGTLDYLYSNYQSILPVAGNHCLMIDMALHAKDAYIRALVAESLAFPSYKHDTLRDFKSYGLDDRTVTIEALDRLSQAIPKHHKKLIHDMPLYVCIGSTLIVHAGLTDEPIEQQLANLDAYAEARAESVYTEVPAQISGLGTIPVDRYGTLVGISRVISGHWHGVGDLAANERVSSDCSRILLAPPRFVNYNFVYESWKEEVVRISSIDEEHTASVPARMPTINYLVE